MRRWWPYGKIRVNRCWRRCRWDGTTAFLAAAAVAWCRSGSARDLGWRRSDRMLGVPHHCRYGSWAGARAEHGDHRCAENAGELLDRLAEDGAGLLAASLQALDEGVVNAVDQPAGSYDVAAKITTQDAHMRFDVPAFALDRQIRACTPAPGAWANLHPHGDDANETLHVSKASRPI